MPKLKNSSVVELSVLRGAVGCLWSNSVKAGHMSIAIFPLFNVPHVSASYDEDTTL